MAAVLGTYGPLENPRYSEVPDPQFGEADVLVRVEAISIEGGDVSKRQSTPLTGKPEIPGISAAGTVVAVGALVSSVRIGDRVAVFNWSGSHAELWAAPEHYVYPIPDGLEATVASTVPVSFGTADEALFDFGCLESGQTVLVRGATGGVGLAAVQLAHGAGATVIATSSTPVGTRTLYALGVDHVIDYRSQDITSEALRVTDGNGVDLLVDLAGGPGLDATLKAVRHRGRISTIGSASGAREDVATLTLRRRMLTMSGVFFGQEMHLPRVHDMVRRHLDSIREGRLQMPIDRVFPLAQAAAAYEYIERTHPIGRVLLVTGAT